MKGFPLLVASMLVALPAHAQPIDADRPSIGLGPGVVDPGVLQVEVGGRTIWDTPAATGLEATQRFGLIPGVELRMTTPVTVTGSAAASSTSWGAKVQFLEGYLLSLGALGNVDLGSDGRTSTQAWALATLGLPAGYSMTLCGGPQWGAEGTDWTGTATLGYDSGNLWKAFAEIARYQDVTGNAVGTGADLGLQVLVTQDVQWDVACFRGLSPEVPDWYLTSGFSWRWGTR